MAVTFDGSTNELLRSTPLINVEDSKSGTFSCWFLTDNANAGYLFAGDTSGDTRFRVRMAGGGLFQVLGENSSSTIILDLRATGTLADTWYHVVSSWNLATGATHLYINRADVNIEVTATDDTIDYTVERWAVGSEIGTINFAGQIYDLAFWPGVYVDLSVAANLRRFISSDGLTDYANPGPTAGTPKPVGYGADGSLPTSGTRPAVYFSGAFSQNRGTGGAFTANGNFAASRGPAHYRESPLRTTPGERWFDSDRSGFSAPRSETFIEDREGIPAFGQRLRVSERDDLTRQERPRLDFSRLVMSDREDDSEDRKTKRG